MSILTSFGGDILIIRVKYQWLWGYMSYINVRGLSLYELENRGYKVWFSRVIEVIVLIRVNINGDRGYMGDSYIGYRG